MRAHTAATESKWNRRSDEAKARVVAANCSSTGPIAENHSVAKGGDGGSEWGGSKHGGGEAGWCGKGEHISESSGPLGWPRGIAWAMPKAIVAAAEAAAASADDGGWWKRGWWW